MKYPLMKNNILKNDIDVLIKFLKTKIKNDVYQFKLHKIVFFD